MISSPALRCPDETMLISAAGSALSLVDFLLLPPLPWQARGSQANESLPYCDLQQKDVRPSRRSGQFQRIGSSPPCPRNYGRHPERGPLRTARVKVRFLLCPAGSKTRQCDGGFAP